MSTTPTQKRKNAALERKAKAQAAAAGTRMQKIPISAGGMAAVQTELDTLKTVRRPSTVETVKRAREEGDLRENAGYHAAREELEQMIKNSVVTESVIEDASIIRVGSTVTLMLGGDEATYTIVGAQEAQPRAGKISNVSPVGSALLGHAVGDEFEITTPGTPMRAIIKDVRVIR